MSGLEVNKILASIFVAFIVIGLISILGDTIINGKNNEQVKNAYYIDITEMKISNVVTNTENEEISEQISMFLTSASFEKGEKLFRKDHKYDVFIPINYNTNPVIPHRGSVIFLHLTQNYKPTAGCIAISIKDFLTLVKCIKSSDKIKIG